MVIFYQSRSPPSLLLRSLFFHEQHTGEPSWTVDGIFTAGFTQKLNKFRGIQLLLDLHRIQASLMSGARRFHTVATFFLEHQKITLQIFFTMPVLYIQPNLYLIVLATIWDFKLFSFVILLPA